jgi:hydroxymethylpyrimidine pyrophosphatase-like HAD family hydrolase
MEDNTTKNIVVCDLSGTLFRTDNTPNPPVVALIRSMHAQGYLIAFLTGLRQRHYRTMSARLKDIDLAPSENIYLLMRPDNYTLAPLTFKEELLTRFIEAKRVLFALDDTPTILRMYAKHGIPTMQVRT